MTILTIGYINNQLAILKFNEGIDGCFYAVFLVFNKIPGFEY